MMLRTLETRHFGCFGERSFEFRRGLNLVAGPNETGKSTLMEAIPAVLFGVRDKERFRPWERPDQCAAALVMEEGDRSLRIERDILTDQVTLTEFDGFHQVCFQFEGRVSPDGSSPEQTEYHRKLAGFLGLSEEEVFRTALFFGPGSLQLPEGSGRRLKALLCGPSQVDLERVLLSLEEEYLSITRENPWGEDLAEDRELEELRAKLAELESRWHAAQREAGEMEGLRKRIGELKESIERDRGEFDKGERYLAWTRRQWRQAAEEGREEEKPQPEIGIEKEPGGKAEELEARRQELSREILKTGLPREIPEDLPVILSEAEKVRKELVSLQGESAEIRRQLLEQGSSRTGLALGLSGLILLCGAGLAWVRPPWLSYALMGAGLLMAPIWLVYLWRAGLRRAERSRIKGQAQVLETRREEAQAELAALDERFERIGMSPSAVEVVKMQKNLGRHRQLSQQLLGVESALKVLEKVEPKENPVEETGKVKEPDEAKAEGEKRPSPEISPEELPDAEAKLQAFGESIREREELLLDLVRQEEEEELGTRSTQIRRIEEEGEAFREREGALVRRKRILAFGRDLLCAAVEEFRRDHLEKVIGEVGRQVSLVTDGRYTEVLFDDDLNYSLRDSKGDWQPLANFSRGTADAVSLAVRLALADALSRAVRLPILMDDPLLNLDRSRLAGSLKMLERLSRDHQVLLFTQDENLPRRAARDRWHVLSLEEAGTRGTTQPQERNDDGGQLYLL